jgi:Flp pilus assembly pilin Flp
VRPTMSDLALRAFVRLQIRLRQMHEGQTMAEYALLLASVATIVYAAYKNMGTKVTGVLSTVDNQL